MLSPRALVRGNPARAKFAAENTARWRYNVVNFLKNPYKKHLIAHPFGRGMGCLLWVHTVIYILPREVQWCMQYNFISDCVTTAPNCTLWHQSNSVMSDWCLIDVWSLSSFDNYLITTDQEPTFVWLIFWSSSRCVIQIWWMVARLRAKSAGGLSGTVGTSGIFYKSNKGKSEQKS